MELTDSIKILLVRDCLKRVAVRSKGKVHLGYQDTNIPHLSGRLHCDCIKDLIPAAKAGGRLRSLDMRQVINAIRSILVTGAQWRLLACAEGRLQPEMLVWSAGSAACVVLAAAGYPATPRAGDISFGSESAAEEPGALLFHAGTDWVDGALVTAGGRVLCVTGLGRTRHAALARAYEVVENISFDGMQYRRDIGRA